MKKVLASVVVIVMLALTLCSCGAKVTCNVCQKEVAEKNATVSEVLGQTVAVCNDCASGNINLG